MIIAIDFDGTCVVHEYPAIGDDIPMVVETLKKLVMCGHKLILWTVRDGKELAEAVEWFKERDIELWGVNNNPESFFKTPKALAHLYIDDRNLGTPLVFREGSAPYVNWDWVHNMLILNGYIPHEKEILSADTLLTVIAEEFDLPVQTILNMAAVKTAKFCIPRSFFFYFAYHFLSDDLNDIAAMFNKDRASIYGARKSMQNLIDTNPKYALIEQRVLRKIGRYKTRKKREKR